MKAITLHPEWAHAVAHLGKRVENRNWRPPASLIGQRIAIHAGKSIGGRPGETSVIEGLYRLERACPYPLETSTRDFGKVRRWVPSGEPLPAWQLIEHSAIVATAILGESVEVAEAVGEASVEYPLPDWAAWGDRASLYWWPLLDVRRLPIPVPCAGKQGFWTVPPDVVARMEG